MSEQDSTPQTCERGQVKGIDKWPDDCECEHPVESFTLPSRLWDTSTPTVAGF